jgi:hypothetical protein
VRARGCCNNRFWDVIVMDDETQLKINDLMKRNIRMQDTLIHILKIIFKMQTISKNHTGTMGALLVWDIILTAILVGHIAFG